MARFVYLHDMVPFTHPHHGPGYFCSLDVIRDSDGTATAAACEDMPVPKDCQARAESIAQKQSSQST